MMGEKKMKEQPVGTRRRILAGVLAIFLAGSFLVVQALAEPSLPSTPLPLLQGGTLNLQSFKGNVVVIRFLASW
jgi:hypothetical protein